MKNSIRSKMNFKEMLLTDEKSSKQVLNLCQEEKIKNIFNENRNFWSGYFAAYNIYSDNEKVAEIFDNFVNDNGLKDFVCKAKKNTKACDLNNPDKFVKMIKSLENFALEISSDYLEGFVAKIFILCCVCCAWKYSANLELDFGHVDGDFYDKISKYITKPSMEFLRACCNCSDIFIARDVDQDYYCHSIIKSWSKFLSDDLWISALKKSGLALQYLSRRNRTAERCMIAVKENGFALQYVPEKLKTEKLCMIAVHQFNGFPLAFVPEHLKTTECCTLAVKTDGRALQLVPDHCLSSELCAMAVETAGGMLKIVPNNIKTNELCLIAVKNAGYALQYVPEKFKTLEMCIIAVKDRDTSIKYVPNSLKKEVKSKIT